MNRLSCWIAEILVLAMVVPAMAPAGLAQSTAISMPHCARHAVGQRAPAAAESPCHGSMAQEHAPDADDAQPDASASDHTAKSASLQAGDACCVNHDCCSQLGNSRNSFLLINAVSSCLPQLEPEDQSCNTHVGGKKISGVLAARAPPLQ